MKLILAHQLIKEKDLKKIFNLSFGEIKKIFLKPFTYLVLVLIIAVIYVSSLIYNPQTTSNKLTYSGSTDVSVFEKFIEDNTVIQNANGEYISVKLESSKQNLLNFKNIEDKLSRLNNLVENCYAKFNKHNDSLLQNAILVVSSSPTETEQAKNAFLDFKTNYVTPVYNYLLTDINSNLNFFLTETDYETLLNFFYELGNNIKDNMNDYTAREYIAKYDFLVNNYNFSKSVYPILTNLEKIQINEETFNLLLNDYYNTPKETLKQTYDKIYSYYLSSDNELEEISELISKYNSTANISSRLLSNELLLSISGNHTDEFMQNKIDYIGFRKYLIKEDVQKSKYLLENNIAEYEVLSSFSFGSSPSKSANAFDFAFYGMRISGTIVIIYIFFIIASNIAEDQSKGTIKLVAIRQITRNKIVSGKYLTVILYGIFLSIFSAIASLLIGASMFGMTNSLVLVAFNGSNAQLLSPYILLLFAVISNVVNIAFFSSIIMLIAMLTKNNALTIFIGMITYLLAILGNGLLTEKTWYKLIPFSHIDLYKFFGNNSVGLLSFSISPDANFALSLVIVIVTTLLCNILSHIIFLKRDVA